MSIELILFGVVALVLVLDFVLKGIKRKKTQDDVERIGEEQSKKKRFNFNYILKRKRNILTFILFVILFKPLVHTFLFTEYLETTSSDKTYIGVNEPTYVLLNGLVREDLHVFNDDFDRKPWSVDDELIIVDNKILYKNSSKLSSIFYGKNKWSLQKNNFKEWIELAKLYDNLLNFFIDSSYKGFNKDEFLLHSNDPTFDMLEIDDLINIDLNLSKSLIEQWISEGKIQEPQPSLNYLIDFFNERIEEDNIPYLFVTGAKVNSIGGFLFMKEFIKIKYRNYQNVPDNIYTVNGEKIYFEGVARDEQKYDRREGAWYYTGSWDKKFYYYKKTKREASFNFHFQNIFKLKLWLIAVSFASLGVLVLLFNDKIKAR